MTFEEHEEDWAVYFSPINEDRAGSIIVDLGLKHIAPVASKPFLLTFTIIMNNPAEDGLSSNGETAQLNRIEDGLIEKLVEQDAAIYAGRIKSGGKMVSYFYSEKTSELESAVSQETAKYPDYRFEHEFTVEKDWQSYFERLYPSPFEMRVIQNGRVIENLERHGDKLEKERLVEHWIYFNSEIDRENFLGAIRDRGFEVTGKDLTLLGESPFSLQLSRIDRVDYESVNEYVLYLWGKVQEFNGDYDGWETFIVKD